MGREPLAKNLLGIRRPIHLRIAIGKRHIGSSCWRGGGCQRRSQRPHGGGAIAFLRLPHAEVPGGWGWGEGFRRGQAEKDNERETCRAHSFASSYFGSVTRRISLARTFCVTT